MDASSVAKKPIELYYVYASDIDKGAYGPPLVPGLIGSHGKIRRPSFNSTGP